MIDQELNQYPFSQLGEAGRRRLQEERDSTPGAFR